MHKIIRLFVLGVALSAVMAACSSSGASPSAAAPSAAAPSAAAPSAAPSAAAAGTTLALADSALGKIVVDGQGKTLYMFTPDEDQAAPTCVDKCAANWPALDRDRDTDRWCRSDGRSRDRRSHRRWRDPGQVRRVPAVLLRRRQGRR